MKLFFFATHLGRTRFIFAENEERAVDFFTLDLVVTAAEQSRFWCQPFPLSRVVEPHRAKLREALSLGLEGIGQFQSDGSWLIYPVGDGPPSD